MGHEGWSFLMECQQEIQDLCAAAAVQIAGRLVRQNQGRVVDQCLCDGNALLLASRQPAGRCPARSMSPTRPSNSMALS